MSLLALAVAATASLQAASADCILPLSNLYTLTQGSSLVAKLQLSAAWTDKNDASRFRAFYKPDADGSNISPDGNWVEIPNSSFRLQISNGSRDGSLTCPMPRAASGEFWLQYNGKQQDSINGVQVSVAATTFGIPGHEGTGPGILIPITMAAFGDRTGQQPQRLLPITVNGQMAMDDTSAVRLNCWQVSQIEGEPAPGPSWSAMPTSMFSANPASAGSDFGSMVAVGSPGADGGYYCVAGYGLVWDDKGLIEPQMSAVIRKFKI